MGMYLNPGNYMFQDVLNGRFYVDKTKLVSFMNERLSTPEKFVCVSRPRRFGKSVDADMLVAYYTRGCDSSAQFEGLDVSRDPSFERHLNSHDVIKLDVTQIVPLADGPENIPDAISRKVGRDIEKAWPEIEGQWDVLSEALQLAFQLKGDGFIFIVDEWDCVFREAAGDLDAQRAYLDFLRDLLKGRPYVEGCYMTGILPIKKYGVHSALNIFTEYSMTDPKTLDGLVGFNAGEVERLCERFDMDMDGMRRWYDGYLLGRDRIHVYNPRSVSGAIGERQFSSFWTSTETYEALRRYIDIDFDGVGRDLVGMLDGQHVPADVGGFENDMTTFHDKNDVYALLVHLGYLGYDQVEGTVFIPNEEIRREFVTALRRGARPQLAKLIADSRELVERTAALDCAYVADAVARAHDSAAGPAHYNDEQALRAAVKLAYIWALDDYLIVDELPGGRGYADLAFIPRPGSGREPMVVELKWDKPADAALAQIRERNHPAAFAGLTGTCLLVGITYREGADVHECAIDRIEL